MFRLVAWKNAHYARVYIILQTAGHYALFPLLYESPGKCRSSRPEVFCKKGVLRNFAKFTGKHKYQSLFFNKVGEISKSTFFHRTSPVDASVNVSK